MSSSNFIDNFSDEIKDLLKSIKNIEEFVVLVQEKYPDFLISSHDDYSDDYIFFRTNWGKYCKSLRTTRKKILICKDGFLETKDYRDIANILTFNGYCMREQCDFIPCEKCNKLLLSKRMYDISCSRDNVPFYVPLRFSTSCSSC